MRFLSVALVLFAAKAASGSIIVSHERDGSIRDSGASVTDRVEFAAGRAGGLAGQPVPDNSGILFFELPTLSAGEFILSADLQVTLFLAQNLSPNEHVDLYALGYVSTLPSANALNSSWYFSDALDTRTGNDLGTNIGATSVFKVADDFITTSTPIGQVSTDNVQDTSLASFINELYDVHGAQGGDYLVLRLNANKFFQTTPVAFHRYRFYASENSDLATRPVLTLSTDVVPEPSTLAIWSLLGLVGVGGAWRRRRRLART